MKNEISVPLPLNLDAKAAHLYSPYITYLFPIQKVKKLKNVFISFTGFCVNKTGLIKECHHDYPVQLDNYRSEASFYYYGAIDRPQDLVTLDNDVVYLAIHHPWYNYYHWICESIFRLWMVRNQLDKLTLVLPEYYKHADFITGSLKPFNLKNIYYIPSGKSLMVRNICLPQIKPVCDAYNTSHLKQVRKFYVDYVSKQPDQTIVKVDKIYISRQKAGRRKVVNETEIIEIAVKHGFSIFYPEDFTFLQQVEIFAYAQYVVGAHGSALTNMLFMPEKSSVLELHKTKTNELTHPSFLFWYMATPLGIKYYHQVCETSGKEDYFEGDYIIDPAVFEKNLMLMLS